MKIAIISDIHDNLPNLEKCLGWCRENEVATAICCGDVTNSETLKVIALFFSSRIYLVRGNMEIYDEAKTESFDNIKYLGRYGAAIIEGMAVGICHEPMYIDRILAAKDGANCEIIFYGHTHKPWTDTIENKYTDHRYSVKIFNPGTVAGTFSRPTFAVWDTGTGKVELKMLEIL